MLISELLSLAQCPVHQHGSVNAFIWNWTEGTTWWLIFSVFVGEIAAYRMIHEDLLGGGERGCSWIRHPRVNIAASFLPGRALWICSWVCMQDCFCSFLFLSCLVDSQPVIWSTNIFWVPTKCWVLFLRMGIQGCTQLKETPFQRPYTPLEGVEWYGMTCSFELACCCW